MSLMMSLIERGLVPDVLVRAGIRHLLRQRLREESAGGVEAACERQATRIVRWREGPLAVATDAANEQHYELPPAFFERVLGPRLKYSSAFWSAPETDLGAAEAHMLTLTCERAWLVDGQRILELGCGWGSLSLYMAEHYPASRIVAVSNSASQRDFILRRRDRMGLDNLEVVTADINDFTPEGHFDRVVSVEMFEHVRNHELLMQRIATWLAPQGKLFVHIFVHHKLAYPFETDGEDNWMGRTFFTGGIMPSSDLLLHFQRDLLLERRWEVNGRHYARTLLAWLERLDSQRADLMPVLALTYGEQSAACWLQRWRLFLLACAELFDFNDGNEWYVAHYLFSRREDVAP